MYRRTLSLVAFCVFSILVLAPGSLAQLNWATHVGGTSSDQSGDIASDASNNIYITGNFTGTADFDGDGVYDDAASAGGEDIFLAKYDETGVLLWGATAGGSGSDEGLAVAADATGNVYITGYFSGGADFDGDTIDDVIARSARDLFVAKYDATGAFQWVHAAGGLTGNGQDAGTDIEVDGDYILVTGYFRGAADFDEDGVADVTSAGNQDGFAARFSASGSLDWVSSIGARQADEGVGITSDGNGGAFISGSFSGNIDINGDTIDDLVSHGGDDGYIVHCNGTGDMMWAIAAGGTGADRPSHIARDLSTGDIYFTGTFRGAADFDGDGVADVTATSADDMFLAKYTESGSFQWVISASGTSSETPRRLLVDNGVIVTGGYQGTIDFDNDGVIESTSSSGEDVFVVEYFTDGSLGNFIVASGNGSDWGTGAVVDDEMNMCVTGTFQNELDILDNGTDELDTYGSHDVFLFCAPRPIPVELVTFDAVVSDHSVHLFWETASETNNAGFEVQMRSSSGGYEALDFVAGHGTTTESRQYSYITAPLESGTYEFRLKQVDFDGTFEYSSTVEAVVGVVGTHVLSSLYPNPFNPQAAFSLTVSRTQQVEIAAYDALGRNVHVIYDGELDAGHSHMFAFQGSGLPSGLYVIVVRGESFEAARRAILLK